MLIAYNGSHYDILKPASKGDEMVSKRLVKASRITLRYEDCAIFSEIEKEQAGSWASVVRGERAQMERRKEKACPTSRQQLI